MTQERAFALVILENRLGHIALQLRDNVATIAHPGHWGLFGGRLVSEEDPWDGVVREVAEELLTALNPPDLVFLQTFRLEPGKTQHVFQYSVTHELDTAVLTEGQRYQWWPPGVIQQGTIEGRAIIPSHLAILRWYWQRRGQRFAEPRVTDLATMGCVPTSQHAEIYAERIPAMEKRLTRSETNRVIAGVCGGLGEYFGINPLLFRIIFVLLSLPGGAPGVLPYIILWIVMPRGR